MERFRPPKVVGEKFTTRYRKLPHWQVGGSTYFITFRTSLGDLPKRGLEAMRTHLAASQGNGQEIPFGVVMPDHVHSLLKPSEIAPGTWADLARIMKSIKGAGARRVNLALGTSGSVWQDESYDRIVRDEQEFEEKWKYMRENPVRAGLVVDPEDYPYFVIGESK